MKIGVPFHLLLPEGYQPGTRSLVPTSHTSIWWVLKLYKFPLWLPMFSFFFFFFHTRIKSSARNAFFGGPETLHLNERSFGGRTGGLFFAPLEFGGESSVWSSRSVWWDLPEEYGIHWNVKAPPPSRRPEASSLPKPPHPWMPMHCQRSSGTGLRVGFPPISSQLPKSYYDREFMFACVSVSTFVCIYTLLVVFKQIHTRRIFCTCNVAMSITCSHGFVREFFLI